MGHNKLPHRRRSIPIPVTRPPADGKTRLPPHEIRFDFANSLHPARYRDNASRMEAYSHSTAALA
jgi:hypothetical protein